MSSLEIAHAVIYGSEPERRVSAEWHKGGSYTVTLLEQTDTPIWHALQTWHPVDQQAALRQFARVVEAQWKLEKTNTAGHDRRAVCRS